MAENLHNDLLSLKIDRSAQPPRRWGRVAAWGAALLLLAGAAAIAKPRIEARLFRTPVSVTHVQRVSPGQASIVLTASGYVKAEDVSRVAPQVAGRVARLHVRQGDPVEAGQRLLELDASDQRAAIAEARSRVAAAHARVHSAKAGQAVAQARLAEIELQAGRSRTLADQHVVPKAEAEDLEARVTSARQALAAAQADARHAAAQVGALEAQVAVLETALDNWTLAAPISGTVINRPPQLGEYVGPQPPGVTVDMGGIRIADLSNLLVETDVPESRMNLVQAGHPARIVLDAYPQQPHAARVRSVTPQVDRAKGTVLVKVAFLTTPAGALPDMSARVSFLSEELDPAALAAAPKTLVASSAVTQRGGAAYVFVLEDDERVRRHPVKLGPASGTDLELLEGPSPGTQLVANPSADLVDGHRVKVTR